MAIQLKRVLQGLTLGFASMALTFGASAVQAQETFSVNGMALNTNNNFARIDGEPRMSIWTRNNSDPDQIFDRLPGNTGTLLRHRSTGKCLNAHRVWSGAQVNVWTCNASDPDQNFVITHLGSGLHQIRRAGTNHCIDSPTRNNGGIVHLWTCDANNPNQRWLSSASAPSPSPSGNISLPFGRGQTWYVCQGYYGPITHRGRPALDLTVGGGDFGLNNSCWAHDGNVSRSAGRNILAPASGIVYHVGADLVCLSIDQNRSLLIGHINRSVAHGQRVNKDGILGITSRANSSVNGGFSHIHIEARRSQTCTVGTTVPFTAQYGFQFEGIGDLPAGQTHWRRGLIRR